MATLADIRTQLARALRDPSNETFTTTELDYHINQGIDALADVYPREIVSDFATVSTGTYSYAATDFTNIYRIDNYSSAGTLLGTLSHGFGGGPDGGWELHAGVVWLPPNWPLQNGSRLRAFGYARYVQLSASSSTTDLDQAGINAVLIYAQAEAYAHLTSDRARYQHWQTQEGNADTSLVQLNNLASVWQGRWHREKARLRRLRKTG